MEEKKIREYAEILRQTGLTALEIRSDGSLRLERAAGEPWTARDGDGAQRASYEAYDSAEADASVVTSPMVGMFYAAPAENADPFVQVGSEVRSGDVLCIIEAMKLMNEIAADCDGVITEILAANGSIVEFGQPLFRLRKGANEPGGA